MFWEEVLIGQKHLIECHCVLPLYRNKQEKIYHKFLVYNKFDDNSELIPKYVKCNNCDIIHYVYEICKSEIKFDGDGYGSVLEIEDLKLSLDEKIVKVLEMYDCDITAYELISDAIDKNIFPIELVLKRNIINEEYHVKILKLNSESKFVITSEKIDSKVLLWVIQLNFKN